MTDPSKPRKFRPSKGLDTGVRLPGGPVSPPERTHRDVAEEVKRCTEAERFARMQKKDVVSSADREMLRYRDRRIGEEDTSEGSEES
jgi:IS4 transposase